MFGRFFSFFTLLIQIKNPRKIGFLKYVEARFFRFLSVCTDSENAANIFVGLQTHAQIFSGKVMIPS